MGTDEVMDGITTTNNAASVVVSTVVAAAATTTLMANKKSNYISIEEELERAKNNLKGLNENIRRIIGRDPPDTQLRLGLLREPTIFNFLLLYFQFHILFNINLTFFRGDRKRTFGGDNNNRRLDRGGGGGGSEHSNNNMQLLNRRPEFNQAAHHQHHHHHNHQHNNNNNNINNNRNARDLSPMPKRRNVNQSNVAPAETKSVFSRLSGPPMRSGRGGGGGGDDDAPPLMNKPKLNSRVIREMPTRQEIVAAQGTDAASKARNRRMFGSLLGTLQKFCQEESRLKQREDRKAEIEKKLDDKQQQERETMKRERQDLFSNRKRQQMEIKMLEMKMQRMAELEVWEEAKKPLLNFVRTKTKPRVYWLPKVMDKKTERKLADSKADMESECFCFVFVF